LRAYDVDAVPKKAQRGHSRTAPTTLWIALFNGYKALRQNPGLPDSTHQAWLPFRLSNNEAGSIARLRAIRIGVSRDLLPPGHLSYTEKGVDLWPKKLT